MQEGKDILDKSLAENTETAYTYKSLGIYYLKLNDVTQAKVHFNKATELDDSIDFGNYTL